MPRATRSAYVDSSALVAVVFGERGGANIEKALAKLDSIYSSALLEAELRSAAHREVSKRS